MQTQHCLLLADSKNYFNLSKNYSKPIQNGGKSNSCVPGLNRDIKSNF